MLLCYPINKSLPYKYLYLDVSLNHTGSQNSFQVTKVGDETICSMMIQNGE